MPLTVMDSDGQIQAGSIYGHVHSIGDYEQCRSVKASGANGKPRLRRIMWDYVRLCGI